MQVERLGVLREETLWGRVGVEGDSGAVGEEADVAVPDDLVDRAVERVNGKPLAAVHHFADVEAVEA